MTPTIFGNFTVDDLVFADGSTRWATPGGSAAYAARGAALWAETVAVVAPIGDDYPADLLGPCIDLSRCRRIPHTMRNWGLYEEDGSRYFITRGHSRNWSNFCPLVSDAVTGPETAAHIAPLPLEIAEGLVRKLRDTGVRVISLDLDDHDLLERGGGKKQLDLLQAVDLFMPSEQDMQLLFPAVTPLEAIHKLRELAPGIKLIAIKCGAQGVIAHLAGTPEYIQIPAVPVTVVDVTGAGDAFCGGVLAGFAEQTDPIEALLQGVVSASFCIEGFGFSALLHATPEMARGRLAELRQRVSFLQADNAHLL